MPGRLGTGGTEWISEYIPLHIESSKSGQTTYECHRLFPGRN